MARIFIGQFVPVNQGVSYLPGVTLLQIFDHYFPVAIEHLR
jgi:hypothetical protein